MFCEDPLVKMRNPPEERLGLLPGIDLGLDMYVDRLERWYSATKMHSGVTHRFVVWLQAARSPRSWAFFISKAARRTSLASSKYPASRIGMAPLLKTRTCSMLIECLFLLCWLWRCSSFGNAMDELELLFHHQSLRRFGDDESISLISVLIPGREYHKWESDCGVARVQAHANNVDQFTYQRSANILRGFYAIFLLWNEIPIPIGNTRMT